MKFEAITAVLVYPDVKSMYKYFISSWFDELFLFERPEFN